METTWELEMVRIQKFIETNLNDQRMISLFLFFFKNNFSKYFFISSQSLDIFYVLLAAVKYSHMCQRENLSDERPLK